MYDIWFCKIISKDEREVGEIGSLEYMELMYNDVLKKDLPEYASHYCDTYYYKYNGIIDNRYCILNDNYCLFFEELLEGDE